ncbi:MAG TPA: hypothetical protein VHD33_03235 [Legionellaceae bacterium]|nr:hypothetical protein [Legionellaceae bacterium]
MTAVRAYQTYCQQHQRIPHPIRSDYAIDWLSALASAGQHKSSTLRGYAAALHWYIEVNELGTGRQQLNPMDEKLVKRVLDGIERSKAEQEQAARLLRQAQESHPLTFDLVKELRNVHDSTSPLDCMYYAAICLGVAASLRPSELLGSSKLRDRALRIGQIQFFDAEGNSLPFDSNCTAQRFQLHLYISKTDQLRRGQIKEISAETAVVAMQQWARLRGSTDGQQLLFQLVERRLDTYGLLSHLRRRLKSIGHSSFCLSGKSFRRGGASSLSVLGIPAQDIARAGWSMNSTVWQNYYANHPQVQAERARIVNAQLENCISPNKKGRNELAKSN